METVNLQIKDLGIVITGGTPPTKKREYYGDIVPLIKPTDMVLGQRYIGGTEESLSDLGVGKFKKKLVPKNTPCVVTIGTIGKSCLTKELSLVNQAVNCVVVDESRFDYMYTYYLMQATIYKVKSLDSGTASGRENVSKSVFESIDVKVVKFKEEQIKLGQLLSNYDSLIENNNRRIAILEDIAQSLYREWFVKFRFPGHEDCRFKDSALGRIPEGWEVEKLSDIAEVNPESITKKNAPKQINYVDIKSVNTGSIEEIRSIEFEGAPSRARRIVRHRDIIWATVRPNRKQFSFIARPLENTIVSTGFAVLRANKVSPEYLYYAVTTDDFTSYLANHATGAAYPAVNAKDFEGADILVPLNSVLVSFDALVSSCISESQVLKAKNRNLRDQRDMLLPKLISGKINI